MYYLLSHWYKSFPSFCFLTAVKSHIHFYRYPTLVCPSILVCLIQHIGWIIANIFCVLGQHKGPIFLSKWNKNFVTLGTLLLKDFVIRNFIN
jgi:hypothetical protein